MIRLEQNPGTRARMEYLGDRPIRPRPNTWKVYLEGCPPYVVERTTVQIRANGVELTGFVSARQGDTLVVVGDCCSLAAPRVRIAEKESMGIREIPFEGGR